MVWPLLTVGLDARFWRDVLLVALLGLAGFLAWCRWRRMGWPETPRSRDESNDAMDRQPDGLARRAATAMWIAVHDTLLRVTVRWAGRRFDGAAARLSVALVRFEDALHRHLESRVPDLRRRRLIAPWVALAALPFLGVADFAFGWVVVQSASGSLTAGMAATIALTITIGYLVAGRFIAHGILRGQYPGAAAAALFALALAWVVAGFQRDHQQQWLVVALVPTIASVMLSMLAHPRHRGRRAAPRPGPSRRTPLRPLARPVGTPLRAGVTPRRPAPASHRFRAGRPEPGGGAR